MDKYYIRQKLIRFLLMLLDRSNYRSKADYWPWIKVKSVGYGIYDIEYSNRKICETVSFDKFTGLYDEVVIIGSGPSVKMMDMKKIALHNYILLNGAISLVSDAGITPLAVVIIDSKFILKRLDMIKSLPEQSNLIITPGVIRAIAERDRTLLSRMNVCMINNISTPIYDMLPEFASHRDSALAKGFSTELEYGYVDASTVMSTALQFVYRIGVKKVYMVGLDIGNADGPRFYETKADKMKSRLLHNYESAILPFMKACKTIFMQAGIDIYNCSPITKLPYEIVPYSDKYSLNSKPVK